MPRICVLQRQRFLSHPVLLQTLLDACEGEKAAVPESLQHMIDACESLKDDVGNTYRLHRQHVGYGEKSCISGGDAFKQIAALRFGGQVLPCIIFLFSYSKRSVKTFSSSRSPSAPLAPS